MRESEDWAINPQEGEAVSWWVWGRRQPRRPRSLYSVSVPWLLVVAAIGAVVGLVLRWLQLGGTP